MKFVRRALPYTLLVALLVGGTAFWKQHDAVLDWLASRGYQPSSLVSSFVTDTAMTPYSTGLFYANRPAVEDKAEFNKHCTDPSEQIAVLGCFKGNRLGIYVYNVTDDRLQGVEQVTAAHEMLHQAYQRLSGKERTRVNGLLQEYHDLRASQTLKDKIASYSKTEPDQLQNEMHSIFGTEAADLSPELETYYKQYFTDRRKVLGLYQQYQAEFDKRITQIETYDNQLTELKNTIESNKQGLSEREKELHRMREQLNAYLAADRISEYNALVPQFNALVVAYRNLVTTTNNVVDQFNRLLAERNTLAVQERQLEAAIDSSVNTAPKQ